MDVIVRALIAFISAQAAIIATQHNAGLNRFNGKRKNRSKKDNKDTIVILIPYIIHVLAYAMIIFSLFFFLYPWAEEANIAYNTGYCLILFFFLLEFGYRRFKVTISDDVIDICYVWKRRRRYNISEVTRVVNNITNKLVLYKGDKAILKVEMSYDGYHDLYKYLKQKGFYIEMEE